MRRFSCLGALLTGVLFVGCVTPEPGVDVVRLATEPALDDVELEFLRLLNEYRESVGSQPLAPVDEINAAADAHSDDMGDRGYFSHDAMEPAPYGVQPWDRMCTFGYGPACNLSTPIGENIAAGYPDAYSVFLAWQGSPGHDANMRDDRFRAIGIGRVHFPTSLYRWYWTTDFAGEAGDCTCADGQQRSCETEDCGPGRSTCQDCEFGACEVPQRGAREICNDSFDNDCDGSIDEIEDCGERCETSPEVCDDIDNDCDGEIDEDEVCDIRCFAIDEVCDGADNDCDFTVDEGCECDSRPSNPYCGSDVGQCTAGTQECEWTGEFRVLTICQGAVAPIAEVCDGFDNDCDGLSDESGVCGGSEDCECRAAGGGGPGQCAVIAGFAVVLALLRRRRVQ
jgi:uncharacterized protein YkwD